jgi:hypothetical protein
MCAKNQPFQITQYFRLLSWCEMPEILLGTFQSVLNSPYVIEFKGRTKRPPGDAAMAHLMHQLAKFDEEETKDLSIEFQINAQRLVFLGLATSANVINRYVRELSPIETPSGPYERSVTAEDVLSPTQEIQRAIDAETATIVFLSIPQNEAEWHKLPLKDWNETTQRWPDTG